MKGLNNIDVLRPIINREGAMYYKKKTSPIRLPLDTIRVLKALKKANKLKSYRAVIELLLATAALNAFNEKHE